MKMIFDKKKQSFNFLSTKNSRQIQALHFGLGAAQINLNRQNMKMKFLDSHSLSLSFRVQRTF